MPDHGVTSQGVPGPDWVHGPVATAPTADRSGLARPVRLRGCTEAGPCDVSPCRPANPPRLTLGGHYHHFHDQVLTVPGAAYPTRVVVLDMNGKDRANLAILDTATLDLEVLYRNGTPAVPDTHEPERTDDGRPGC
jgi:hypothetical protein